jgi:hypothetical protein
LRIHPGRPDGRHLSASRAIAFVVALLVLLVSLSAEAKKKKKSSKKHKTPAAKHTSKSKSKAKESDRGLPPPESAPETDEASKEKEEKASAPSKAAAEPGEGEEKPAPPRAAEEEETPKPPAPPPKAVKPRLAAEPEGESAGGAPLALSIGVGGKALFRNLSWSEAMGALAPYKLSPGPEIAVWMDLFPLAFLTDGFASNIGIYGHFDYGLAASSKTPSGMMLTTKYQDFFAGLKIRFPVGIMLPYIAGGYGMQKFSLDPVAADRPNFNYSFASGGAGARIQFTPMFDLDASGMYLAVLNPGSAAGEVASNAFYPKATAYGVDFSLSFGLRLLSFLGVRVGGDFRQFGLTTHWTSTTTGPRAGGAADRYITAWGGVEIVFDGLGGGGGASEEAAPAKKAAPKAKKPAPAEGEPEGDEAGGTGGGGGAGAGSDTDRDE